MYKKMNLRIEDSFNISIMIAGEPHPPNQDLEGASIDLNTPYKQ